MRYDYDKRTLSVCILIRSLQILNCLVALTYAKKGQVAATILGQLASIVTLSNSRENKINIIYFWSYFLGTHFETISPIRYIMISHNN